MATSRRIFLAGDFDDDGWPDIYVACDSTPSLLFMSNHDGTFREEGAIRGVAYGEDGQEQAGMGAAAGDDDLDGRLDIFNRHTSRMWTLMVAFLLCLSGTERSTWTRAGKYFTEEPCLDWAHCSDRQLSLSKEQREFVSLLNYH